MVSKSHTIPLTHVPADIRRCFKTLTGEPMPGAMDKEKVMELIAALRASEVRKSQCGKRLLALYDAQSKQWETMQ